MRIVSFEIHNFRGIKLAKVDLAPAGAGIFTLIGLNESGKTTVLEAISTFQVRGGDEKSLYQAKPAGVDPSSYVPKHLKATFTGDIVVKALVAFEGRERTSAIEHAQRQSGSKIDPDSVPDQFVITRGYRFLNGDQTERLNLFAFGMLEKKKGTRKFTDVDITGTCWSAFCALVNAYLPEIVYFPTFLFPFIPLTHVRRSARFRPLGEQAWNI